MNQITEAEARPWDVIQTPNGNFYVVLPDRLQAYVGNASPTRADRSELVEERPSQPCVVVGHIEWTQ